ncbi:DUF5780 domain-containing protein [Paenibacillus sp. EC2-1]|uniref:DUF5780 domain-containing protein n=1 Tax=Paenibacillus sp. EC2-1 TaxID=3388665 RepID=UPI003BEEE6C3
MIKCNKCGNEALEDDSVFCKKCGKKISTSNDTNLMKRKKLLVLGGSGILALVILVTILLLLNNPITKFQNAVESNQYLDANTIYSQEIKGDSEQENKAENFMKDELKRINQDFKNNKINYQKASISLDTIKKLELVKSDVEATIISIDKLNDSRTSFKKGQEFIANKNYKDGISEFKKVITDDENYAKAQELISTYITEYKTNALKDAKQLSTNNDYDKAISILSDALVLIPNDSDVSAKKASYEKLNEEKKAIERKKKMEELKNSQEVSVESAIIVRTGTYIDFYHTQVIVKNNSNKVVKNYVVGWLAYDNQGYPINLDSNDHLTKGNAKAVNIQPNTTYGQGSGWSIYSDSAAEKTETLLACVIEVEYYDDTKWTNPYYEYWLTENKGKPLH